MKICTSCFISKSLDSFAKSSAKCKPCIAIYAKEYRKENKEKIAENKKEYRKENKEKIAENKKEYRKENKEKIAENNKEYQKENKEKLAEYKKEFYKENKEKIAENKKEYRKENKEKIAENNKEYQKENKEKLAENKKEYRKEKYRTNVLYRLSTIVRSRTGNALKQKRFNKTSKFAEYLGCTAEHLKSHLESQFQSGMSWDNHSLFGWHIDHIIPLASASSAEELYKLCHYTNLQPLWAEDNLAKSDNLPLDNIRK